jgi:hypothetical protein
MPRIGPTGQSQIAATILGAQRNELERERLSDERKNASRGRALQAISLANDVGGILSTIADKAADRAAADSRLARELGSREKLAGERLTFDRDVLREDLTERRADREQRGIETSQRDTREKLLARIARATQLEAAKIRADADIEAAGLRSRGDRAIGTSERGGIFNNLGTLGSRGSLSPETVSEGMTAAFQDRRDFIEDLMRQGAGMDAAVALAGSDEFFDPLLPDNATFDTFRQSEDPIERLTAAAALAKVIAARQVDPEVAAAIMEDAYKRLQIESAAGRLRLQDVTTKLVPSAGRQSPLSPGTLRKVKTFTDAADPDLTTIIDLIDMARGVRPQLGPHGEVGTVDPEALYKAIENVRKRTPRPKKKK